MKIKLFICFSIFLLCTFQSNAQLNHSLKNDSSRKNILINGTIWSGYTTNSYGFIAYGGNLTLPVKSFFEAGISFIRFSDRYLSYWEGIHELTKTHYLNGYYLGIFAEPKLYSKYPIHLSLPILFGTGKSILYDHEIYQDGWTAYDLSEKSPCTFWVFEPGIEIELNLLKFMRMGIGAKYRLTNALTFSNSNSLFPQYSEYPLNGTSLYVSLKFGRFYLEQ